MTGQTSFLQIIGWALLNSLWQMAILWVIYQLITGLITKITSSAKASLASVFLIVGFTWFIYTFISIFINNDVSSSILINNGSSFSMNSWLQKILPVASVIYFVLLVIPLAHFIKNYRYVQVIRRYGLSKPEAHLRLFIQKLSAQMGIRRRVHIWVSEFVSSPVTIGFLKPVILVPLAAINHLSA